MFCRDQVAGHRDADRAIGATGETTIAIAREHTDVPIWRVSRADKGAFLSARSGASLIGTSGTRVLA
jgi:hypothetical protein